jgi:Tol biopolymer transport system component
MPTFHRLPGLFVFIVFLVGCSTTNLTSVSDSTPAVDDPESLSTNTARPSFTPSLSATPDRTQISQYETADSKMFLAQTAAPRFPRLCKNPYPGVFSPTGSWLGEFCTSKADRDQVLTVSNAEKQVMWKLFYRDYLFDPVNIPDGSMAVVQWSNDEKYMYFNSFSNASGSECFDLRPDVTDSGWGLFRLELDTGIVKTVLPLNDNYGWYRFSFSPTGRRLVYGAVGREVRVLDLQTGQQINVNLVNDFGDSGGYAWSPDGLKFVYSTVTSYHQGAEFSSSVRLVDARSGSEQILLESSEACYGPIAWVEDDVLILKKNYNEALIEFDLNSNKIINEATITP